MALSLRPLKPEIYPPGSFRIPPGEGTFRVGRDAGNDLRVEHASVSSLHAELAVQPEEGVEVVDCGSSNGTFVNGIRVERRRLAEGDLVRFATAEFRVVDLPVPSSNGNHDGTHHTQAPEEPEELLPEEETLTRSTAEAEKEALRIAFREEREGLRKEIEHIAGEVGRLRAQTGTLLDQAGKRDSEIATLTGKGREQEELIRRLQREIDEAAQREQRILANLSEARRDLMDREGAIAALRYELTTREGNLRQTEEQRARLQQVCDDYAAAYEDLQARLAETSARLEESDGRRAGAEQFAADLLERLAGLGGRLLSDWRTWIAPGDPHAVSAAEGADVVFTRVEQVASGIRRELDHIEPIWHHYGDGVQAELSRRCEALRLELSGLDAEICARREDLGTVEADLAQFREILDEEVRRAQGLSRRGIEIEIPERFESMVIARDREQEIYRSLIERLEVLDLLLGGYRRSRKLREVAVELGEFRNRLAAILEAGGVRLFELEPGTFLTLKHRREVQVLSRKGWGTRQYTEYPFQPGEVTKVIRPGYLVGEGDAAVILRKVEVLIRGVDD